MTVNSIPHFNSTILRWLTCKDWTTRSSPGKLRSHQPHNMSNPAEDAEGIRIPTGQWIARTVLQPRWHALIVVYSDTWKKCAKNQRGSTNRSAVSATKEESHIFAIRGCTKQPRRRNDQSGRVNWRGKANTARPKAILHLVWNGHVEE